MSILAELIREKRKIENSADATATPATLATHQGETGRTVATVATVARVGSENRKTETGWLRVTDPGGHERIVWPSDPADYPDGTPFEFPVREPGEPLTAEQEQRIRAALSAIQEDAPDEIADVVATCRNDADARSYWLRRATELLAPTKPRLVTCGSCQHFNRLPDHPHLGRCKAGCRENAAGLWDDDSRLCGSHRPRGEQ